MTNAGDGKPEAFTAPGLSLRIDLAPGRRIGPGKIRLLEAIAADGSISAAARRLAMSYKRAWDLVEDLNAVCGRPVIATRSGGKRGGGAALTPFGALLVASFRAIERDADGAAQPHLRRLQAELSGG